MSGRVNVAIVQMTCGENKAANVEKAVARIGDAARGGADVICLQELFASHYPCQDVDHARFDWAEPIPGSSSEAICEAARQYGVVVVGSFFERRAAGVYHNTAVVFDAGQEVGRYRKMHIPDDPLYHEKFYFTPGDLGFRTFDTSRGPLGVCICWDQWFPEAARLTAMSGAQILFFPTAIGWIPNDKQAYGAQQVAAWETMMRSHAIANGVFVAAPNRVGVEGQLEFWGSSFICDPNGSVLSQASRDQEEIVQAVCDLAQVDAVRTHWPFLRDRRVDAYHGLTQRFLDHDDT